MSSELDHDRLALLVHEVRSPVAALAAVAGAAASELTRDDAALGELMRLALGACGAIERIVLDAATASVHAEPVDLGALTRDVVAAHVVRGEDVETELADGLVVHGDPVRLRQVLDNLIDNALRHGRGTSVTVRVGHAGDTISLAVSDTGPGIPESELERIFEPGVRLPGPSPGSGLGLALARAISEAHGGSLAVESQPGRGATFTVALPALGDHPETEATSS